MPIQYIDNVYSTTNMATVCHCLGYWKRMEKKCYNLSLLENVMKTAVSSTAKVCAYKWCISIKIIKEKSYDRHAYRGKLTQHGQCYII